MPRRAETDQQLLDRIGLAVIEKRERERGNRNRIVALAFMSPALVLVVGVLLVPVGINIYLSFMNWRKFTGINEFAGLANYADLGSSPYFFDALVNTVTWVAASLVFPILIGLGLALLFRGARFGETFKNIIFLPRILAPTAVAVLWYYVYAPHGLLNRVLGFFTGRSVDVGWLYDQAADRDALHHRDLRLADRRPGHGAAAARPQRHPEGPDRSRAHRWRDALGHVSRHHPAAAGTPTLLVVTILCVLAGFTVFDLLWVMGAGYPGLRTVFACDLHVFRGVPKGRLVVRLGDRGHHRPRRSQRHLAAGLAATSRRADPEMTAAQTTDRIDIDAISSGASASRIADPGSRSPPAR